VIQRPALHVLGCAPAGGNPGEPCSGYLVTAGGSRILLDCGPGVLSSLLARDAAPLDAIVLSHLHFDHVADLIPLGFAHVFGLASEWKPPALFAPPGGEARLAALCEASGHGADHLTSCGLTVGEYEPDGPALAIGDARLMFRELIHPGVSHAIRVEAGGAALVYSGDTAATPALGEHAAGADLLLTESTALPSSDVHLPAADAGRIAREAGCKGLVLTHLDVRERAPALRQAREAFGGPVHAAIPGLRVAA
jgi:ribonuclease BN (tRNA processing enzyme)